MNSEERIDPNEEVKQLKENVFLFNRGFMVSVKSNDGKTLFPPNLISNFSIDGKKIFITIYDILKFPLIEEQIDDLLGKWIFKPRVKITLIRLDAANKEVYKVDYLRCKLKKYHGKNHTYKNNEPHQWYLEFKYVGKNISKTIDKVEDYTNDIKNLVEPKLKAKSREKDIVILNNSNKMLTESANKVKVSKKPTKVQKKNTLSLIEEAKHENESQALNDYNAKLKKFDLNDLEKDLVSQINELERTEK